jgi:hypothetical protein
LADLVEALLGALLPSVPTSKVGQAIMGVLIVAGMIGTGIVIYLALTGDL